MNLENGGEKMLGLWKKKDERINRDSHSANNFDEYLKRISELNSKIALIETNIELLKTNMANLRGQFNSKLKGIKEEEAPQEKKIETINNSEFVAFG